MPRRKPKLQHDGMGYHITPKGYPRFNNCGKMRGMYIHRYEAAKMLGRPLRKDEEVHHGRGGKMDFSHANLTVMGNAEHHWITARQAFWMRVLDKRMEKDFYDVVEQLEREGVRIGL